MKIAIQSVLQERNSYYGHPVITGGLLRGSCNNYWRGYYGYYGRYYGSLPLENKGLLRVITGLSVTFAKGYYGLHTLYKCVAVRMAGFALCNEVKP